MLVDTYDLYLRYLLIDTNDIYQITDQGLSLLTILGRYGEGTNYALWTRRKEYTREKRDKLTN
jgi:hypothetical protein